MASPQIENGYTPIANELLEAILLENFIATDLKIILCCCRFTYGFSRKSAKLSLSYISAKTGLSTRQISKALTQLIKRNIIKVVEESTYTTPRIIALNKNYKQWRCRTTVPQVNDKSTVEPQLGTTVEPQFHTTVEPQFHHDKQDRKQDIKQEPTIKKKNVPNNTNYNFIPENIRKEILDFIQFRKEIKSPMTEKAITLLLGKLEKLAPNNIKAQREILEQSIMNGWKSVYEVKNNYNRPKLAKDTVYVPFKPANIPIEFREAGT